ncbi:LysR family transcriptional regulator [Mangrovicoccus algicola]|uniref:LysR family transcriptional regulator n=1 Tax=Mangrovicoccus algicola TaxID=2771008 RepID=A0A8J6Z3K6_9RHOB|nr:LysR family transcriptional regulator [Mangrovicoccus algicola]MBE3636834.1 LysR family transcriptional regulator [Mangrovicoccus algicola]
MDWEDARMFLAVAREGQLLGAARRLGVNQATLSRRLTQLERALQVTLVLRGPQGCALTGEGQALMARIERAEAAMQEAEALFRGQAARLSGTVRIGAPDGFGLQFLAPRLGALARRHPELRLELVPVPRAFSLSQREADVAILVGRPERGRAVASRLTDYTLGLYASHRYLAAAGMPARPEDLRRHRLVGNVEDLVSAPGLDYVTEFFGETRPGVAISTAFGQLGAVRGGAGIGVLHDFIAAGDPGLVPVLPQMRATRAYWLAYHESQRAIHRVQAVAEFIRAEVSAAGGWQRAD